MPRNKSAPGITVVKLGGSLAYTPHCAAWLDVLAVCGGPLILVPGGGPFADCVRAAQAVMGFDDRAAHRMALMAMEQFGLALAARATSFVLADSCEALHRTLRAGKFPIWLPSKMVLADPQVPECWEMTSDSLAAWLAGIIGAPRLLLIKSRDRAPSASLHELAADKIVDPMFPHFATQSHAEVWLAGPASLAGAAHILQRGGMVGSKLAVS
jgi:aspartokinase-like uncharacterized kinase